MSLVDLGQLEFEPLPPLVVPHSRSCRNHTDLSYHCYGGREWELEDRVVDHLTRTYPYMKVSRQERWPGIGIVDVVCRTSVPGATVVTIVELKVTPVRRTALNQLHHYVTQASRHYDTQQQPYAVYGLIGAFYSPPRYDTYLPHLGRWFMDLEGADG